MNIVNKDKFDKLPKDDVCTVVDLVGVCSKK